MSTISIIPIGGIGVRMNSSKPKQFFKVNGKSIYLYTLETFQNNCNIDSIIIATLEDYIGQVEEECQKNNITKVKKIVKGGKTQLESIYNCLISIKKELKDNDKIIVHVGNRPNVSSELITTSICEYDNLGTLSTVVPEIEVMINPKTKKVIPRDDVVRVQTPQVYSTKDLHFFIDNGEQYFNEAATLCDLFVKLGKKISFIPGELMNFKITYPEDYEMFKRLKGK